MKLQTLASSVMLTACLALPGLASGLPVSSCMINTDSTQTCNLYESDATGNFTERPPAVFLPTAVINEYVILLEFGTLVSDQNNPLAWSDLVVFTNPFVRLYSEPFLFGTDTPFTVADVLAATHRFIVEPQNLPVEGTNSTVPVVFFKPNGPFQDTFNVFSDAGTIPEPSSTMLLFAGALALVYFRSPRVRGWNRVGYD
jgi:hypothetical protein